MAQQIKCTDGMKNFLAAALICVCGFAHGAEPKDQNLTAFNFEYNMDGVSYMRPVQVFDDGRLTYFQFQPGTEIPVIYSSANQLLNGRYQGQFYVVSGVYPEIILRNSRAVARVYQRGAQVGSFMAFQTEQAGKEAASSIKQRNTAFDFNYEVLGTATEKPRLIYNDGHATWIEISDLAKVMGGVDAVRSGPYWRIDGIHRSIKLSVGSDKKPQLIEIVYNGNDSTSIRQGVGRMPVAAPVVSQTELSGQTSASSRDRMNVAKHKPEVAASPQKIGAITGSFSVEVDPKPKAQPTPVKRQVKQFDIATYGARPDDPGVLGFSKPVVKSSPELIRRLAQYLDENGLGTAYEIAASPKEAAVLVAQLNRLGAMNLTVTSDQFNGARVISIDKLIEGSVQ